MCPVSWLARKLHDEDPCRELILLSPLTSCPAWIGERRPYDVDDDAQSFAKITSSALIKSKKSQRQEQQSKKKRSATIPSWRSPFLSLPLPFFLLLQVSQRMSLPTLTNSTLVLHLLPEATFVVLRHEANSSANEVFFATTNAAPHFKTLETNAQIVATNVQMDRIGSLSREFSATKTKERQQRHTSTICCHLCVSNRNLRGN